MNINQSAWRTYPCNDGAYVDPLYAPYQGTAMHVSQKRYPGVKVNDASGYLPGGHGPHPWKRNEPVKIKGRIAGSHPAETPHQRGCEGSINPGLVRQGWGLSFQLYSPDDPCPIGYQKGVDGWCVPEQAEFGDHGLYSTRAHIPKYQYFNGYCANQREDAKIEPDSVTYPDAPRIGEFANQSINYMSGNYVTYHTPQPRKDSGKYLRLPSRDMMLA